jgi:hypothetical protein
MRAANQRLKRQLRVELFEEGHDELRRIDAVRHHQKQDGAGGKAGDNLQDEFGIAGEAAVVVATTLM